MNFAHKTDTVNPGRAKDYFSLPSRGIVDDDYDDDNDVYDDAVGALSLRLSFV